MQIAYSNIILRFFEKSSKKIEKQKVFGYHKKLVDN